MLVRTWRPEFARFGDILGLRDHVNLEIHSEAVTKQVWRYNWIPRYTDFGDALGVHDRLKLKEYFKADDLDADDLEAVDLEVVNLEAVDREGGVTAAVTLYIGYRIIGGIYRIEYNKVHQAIRDWQGAGDSQSWDDAVLGVCSTWCMQYLVLTNDHGIER